ncbi:MAG: hypothetical protein IKR93_01700, partial [Firmicutes bacterium]|nr:hypothetical protein [Bacillota bacterium]
MINMTDLYIYILIGLLAAVLLLLVILLVKTRPGAYSGTFTDVVRKELSITQDDIEDDIADQVRTLNEASQQ